MFARFTQDPEGLQIYVRTAHAIAFSRTAEGGTRIFLGGGLSCLVAEDEEQVCRTLAGDDRPTPDQA